MASHRRPVAVSGIAVLGLGCLLDAAAGRPASAAPFFTGLGDLPGGGFASVATAISGDGTVVVGTSDAGTGHNEGWSGFRWEAGAMAILNVSGPTLFDSVPTAVSADGDVTVGYLDIAPEPRGIRWQGTTQILNIVDPYGTWAKVLDDMSADASVIIGSEGSANSAFRWEGGVSHWLATDPSSSLDGLQTPVFTSADGSRVVGRSGWPYPPELSIWEDGVVTSIGAPPGLSPPISIFAVAMSADGSTVFAVANGDGWIHQGGVWVAPEFWAPAGSADGSVLVGSSEDEAALWLDGDSHFLDDYLAAAGISTAGWTITSIGDVSDDGRTFIGTGQDPSGNQQAWIAHVDACLDARDDDGDGATDYPADPGCQNAQGAREDPQCQNGLDDDGDGKIDFDGGASLNGGVPIAPIDGPCAGKPWRNRETGGGCGLGAETSLAAGALLALRRRMGSRSPET